VYAKLTRALTSSLCQSPIKRGLRVRVTQPRSKASQGGNVINHPPEPKIVRLEGWEEQELFSDGLDKGF